MLTLFQSQALQEPDDAVFTYEPGTRLSCFKVTFFRLMNNKETILLLIQVNFASQFNNKGDQV